MTRHLVNTPRTGGRPAKNCPPAGSPNTHLSTQEMPIMAHPDSVDQTQPTTASAGPDTSTTSAAPMPATLATARAEIRRLRTDLATALAQLREATAYIDVIEKERDDAFADADFWREQAHEQAEEVQA
jgi:hypothetical protein